MVRRALQNGAVAVVFGSFLIASACDDADDRSASTTTAAAPQGSAMTTEASRSVVEQVGEAAGCDKVEPTGVAFQFGGRAEQFVCRSDGRDVALIHGFVADRRESVVEYLDMRVGSSELNPCPDGSRPDGPWIIVGQNWAVSSYDESRMRSVASAVGGEFVGGGATPDDPPVGPPVSYLVPGFCD